MASNTFALQIGEFAALAKENSQQVVRKVAGDVLAKTVLRTPVGNPSIWKSKPPAGYVGGRLRANWVTTYGNPSFITRPGIDKTGDATILKGQATIRRAPAGETIYILNSLPYAIPVEFGHSSQAPAGMVRLTVAEFQSFVDNAVRSVQK